MKPVRASRPDRRLRRVYNRGHGGKIRVAGEEKSPDGVSISGPQITPTWLSGGEKGKTPFEKQGSMKESTVDQSKRKEN